MELLQVNNLSRSFGTVSALSGVTFTLAPGEILGVVGQRGSGKSTLFQLLSGVCLPTGGEISFAGQPILFKNAAEPLRLGIETVYQHPHMADNLTVQENVFLGRELRAGPAGLKILPNEKQMIKATGELLAAFDLSPELIKERTFNLTNEQRQLVALARALSRPCRLLLIDDVLGALTFARQQTLIQRLQELAAGGVAVIISSDDLKQLFAVTHRILVLYQGRQVALRHTAESTPREIVELIVGSTRQTKITPVIWAFENYHEAQQQAEELRRSQSELRQNLAAQDSLNRELIERLHKQVEALDGLNLALQEASRRLITEREAERKALARELHDQIIQDLLSYNYQLEEAENETAGESQREELSKIRLGIREVIGGLRQICSDLRPPTIDNHGLSAAIRSLLSQWSEQNNISVALKIDPALGRLPEPIELSVFRIVQEGLNNIRKHSGATEVTLTLERSANASLIVCLADNGQGMAEPIDLATLTEQKHFGLVGISERVSLLNGTLQVSAAPTGGLQLLIEIPSPYPSIN